MRDDLAPPAKHNPPDEEKPITRSSEAALQRILKNSRSLISGKAFGGVASLAYLAIAARTLGPDQMGYLVLAHAYVTFISRVARFQSWQAVIRFGTPLVKENNWPGFRTLIRYTIKFDILSAFLAVAIAVGFLDITARFMQWPEDARILILIYCIATPFLIAATPTGILQLFDEFKVLSWQLTITPFIRLVGSLMIWLIGGGLTEFLIVWIASIVGDGLTLWYLGWRELKRQDLLPRARYETAVSKDWLPFMVKTNLSSTLDQAQDSLPVLFVGGILGSAASGFLQLATNLSNLVTQPTNMLNNATYPELSRVYAHDGIAAMGSVAWRSIKAALLIAVPIVLVYMVFGDWLAKTVGGPAFVPAGILVGLMALTQLWRIASLILESAVLTVGRAGFILFAQSISSIVIVGGLVLFLDEFGGVVAPLAIIAGWTSLITLYLLRLSRSSKSASQASQKTQNVSNF